jgi:hypothetical protein
MTTQELIHRLEEMDPTKEIYVHRFKADDTEELFEIDDVSENDYAQIAIREAGVYR